MIGLANGRNHLGAESAAHMGQRRVSAIRDSTDDIAELESKKYADVPIVEVTTILSADVNSAGQAIVFPERDGHVDVTVHVIAPGAKLPIHKHPFPRLGYVLAGTLRVTNVETQRVQTYTEGQFTLEAVDEWHTGENAGLEELKLLVVDLTEMASQNTVLHCANLRSAQ